MRLLLAAFAIGGCGIPDQYVCHTSPQCGSGGTCIAGTCAFPDDACPTGLRLLGADCVAFVPPHLGTTTIGSGDLVLTSGTIDTKNPSISTAGVNVTIEPQTTGPELVVVHAHTVTVPANAVVGVIGTRPIVFVALSIDIEGTLDVGGHASSPGAGLPSTGPGTGGMGMHTNNLTDSGGGGGGFGTSGAAGGDAGCASCTTAIGGGGGQTSGDALMGPLVPGFSGGDDVSGCGTTRGGAGGGAIQLSAVASITIAGNVLAGGGGGEGGTIGNGSCNFSAAGGGGSGGMIVIQAADIAITGVVAANGGAGGSGATSNPNLAGNPGADGGASAMPALGGAAVGTNNTPGGNGAAGATIATAGGSNTALANDNGNGGGGGGGMGRIALIGSAATTGATISPAPVTDRRR